MRSHASPPTIREFAMFRKVALAAFAAAVGMIAASTLIPDRHTAACDSCGPHDKRQPSQPTSGPQDQRDGRSVNVRTDGGEVFR